MPRRLETNVLASVVNAVAVLGASLVAVPLILAAVGTAGFGVWSLGLAILVYASMADAGLGPAIQRFTAVAKGADDDDGVAQLVWTMLVTYAAVGAIAVLVLHLSSRGIVS